ncbi:hypothetical protein G6N05_05230 [Flavobacterium sp. F372]|uniref:Uncharacterized protein n=1 Tax=Flavobacterium bernardetii TaxID=2813823 RepID=A0ABR7J1J4_9FLAO|nr:hypothetical protein [Flavobacterium bernardetii]MBC5835782.1 hypothetical protein [Flavobacterium bernardetii]NHF69513.1 hypothetical protein [Flavobacterium bernardetii]
MINKSTTNNGIKNNVYTPNEVKQGLKNIPAQYILKVQEVLEEKIKEGLIEKNFSKTYIAEVRKGIKFNVDIMNALVQVGLANLAQKKQFGFNNKKTPSAL